MNAARLSRTGDKTDVARRGAARGTSHERQWRGIMRHRRAAHVRAILISCGLVNSYRCCCTTNSRMPRSALPRGRSLTDTWAAYVPRVPLSVPVPGRLLRLSTLARDIALLLRRGGNRAPLCAVIPYLDMNSSTRISQYETTRAAASRRALLRRLRVASGIAAPAAAGGRALRGSPP